MNLKRELQTMSISDLRAVCRELGVSCPTTKSGIIKRLLDPLKMEYRMSPVQLTLKTPTSSSSSRNKTPSAPRSGGSNKLDESIKEPVDIADIIKFLKMLLQIDNLYDYEKCIELALRDGRQIYGGHDMFYFKIFLCYMSSVDNGKLAKKNKKDFKRIDILRRRYFHHYWIKDVLTENEKGYIKEIAKIIKKNLKNNRKSITGTKRKRLLYYI